MPQNSGLMQGKRGVILGVANNRSIARALAKACHRDVTGEVHHVDSGYHGVGMKRPDAPDISRSHSPAKE
jgi:enoyl-[acyl-carrier-protein] reductase (NADH)